MAADPEADRSLREALAVLRDQAADDTLRRRIDDVLEGRASLRELARSEEFSVMVTPLAERGYRRWDELAVHQDPVSTPGDDAGLLS